MDDPGPPREDQNEQVEDRMLSGDTATIQLDNGEVVDVPVEYLEIAREVVQTPGPPPEPGPNPGDDEDEEMESTTTPEEPRDHPDAWQPEPVEIPDSIGPTTGRI